MVYFIVDHVIKCRQHKSLSLKRPKIKLFELIPRFKIRLKFIVLAPLFDINNLCRFELSTTFVFL